MSKDKVRIAMVGISGRGSGLLGLLLEMEDVEVLGVCDRYPDRLEKAAKQVQDASGVVPLAVSDYRRLLEDKNLDALITPSSWTSHAQICLDGMEAGKYVATEVGGATSIEQCWSLVRTSERTGKPCMLLENCCYGQEEMTVLNMVKKGLFGELIHAEGGYRHDLREEVCQGRENRHYRLENYMHRNGDVYPTHDLGPIAKYLNVNRGNRMLSLTSTASKSRGLNVWAKTNKGADHDLADYPFALGDVVTTVIKCAHGETITLFHDTSLPRPYSRGNLLQGTKGIWMEDKHGIYLEGLSEKAHTWEDISKYYEQYEHPLWKRFHQEGVKGGHGGMDWLVLRAFVESVQKNQQTPVDVYDTAAWMAITCLSEDSVSMGSMPVAIPDFTEGRWIAREPVVKGTYCLEEVCEEYF
ncbi:MAG: Gfo/Idh/MocA family oxidoreductase [Lentisphaeria bacterium]